MAQYKIATNTVTGRRHICVRDGIAQKTKQKVYFNIVGWKQRGEHIQFIYDKEAVFQKEFLEISEFQEITPKLVKELQEEYFTFMRDNGHDVYRTTGPRAKRQKYVIEKRSTM